MGEVEKSLSLETHPSVCMLITVRKRSKVWGKNWRAWACARGVMSSFSGHSTFIRLQVVCRRSSRLCRNCSAPFPWVALREGGGGRGGWRDRQTDRQTGSLIVECSGLHDELEEELSSLEGLLDGLWLHLPCPVHQHHLLKDILHPHHQQPACVCMCVYACTHDSPTTVLYACTCTCTYIHAHSNIQWPTCERWQP